MGISIKRHMNNLFRQRISEHIQLDFIKQLHRLLTNGYSLLDALKMFQWDGRLSQLANQLSDHLKDGLSIDLAFGKEGFHHSVTAYLYFSRVHGNLPESLQKCITMLDHRLNAMNKLQHVIRYPMILAVFFLGLLYMIKQTVFPSFITIYESQGHVSPILNISIIVIDIFLFTLIALLIITAIGMFVWVLLKRNLTVQQLKKVYQNIPFVRRYITLKTSYQLAVHLSSLLKTDLNPLEILKVIAQQNELPIIADTAQQAIDRLMQGVSLSEAFYPFELIDDQFTYILQKNSNMRSLEIDLNMYVEIVQERIHDGTIKYISLIQPIFLIIVASFIVFLYVSLMWPMFQLIQTI